MSARRTSCTAVRTVLVLSVLGVARIAAAAPGDLTGMIGIGASSGNDGNGSTGWGMTIDGLVGYRATPHLSLGIRASVGTAFHISYDATDGGGDGETGDYYVTPIDLGFTGLYQYRRLWVAPWIGEHFSHVEEKDYWYAVGMPLSSTESSTAKDFVMLGITAGVDVLELGGNALALYADYRHGTARDAAAFESYTNWSALTVGVAFHRL